MLHLDRSPLRLLLSFPLPIYLSAIALSLLYDPDSFLYHSRRIAILATRPTPFPVLYASDDDTPLLHPAAPLVPSDDPPPYPAAAVAERHTD